MCQDVSDRNKCKCGVGDKHFFMMCTASDNNKAKVGGKKKKNYPKPKATDSSAGACGVETCEIVNDAESNDISANIVTLTVPILVGRAEESGSNSILPTVTLLLKTAADNCSTNKQSVRALKDSGCQASFILWDVAKELQFPILNRGMKVRLNGLNASKVLHTYSVQVCAEFGGEIHRFEAICLPEIKVLLQLPELGKIVKGFQDRGYTLADKHLCESSKVLDSMGLIMGVNSAHCTVAQDVTFGSLEKSMYSMSKGGVVLVGEISLMKQNLQDLLPYESTAVNSGNKLTSQEKVTTVADSLEQRPQSIEGYNEANKKYIPVSANLVVMDTDGNLDSRKLSKATKEALEVECDELLAVEHLTKDEQESELNQQLVEYALDNLVINSENRIQIPLLWNSKTQHWLGENYKLANAILHQNKKRLGGDRDRLKLMDDVFRTQLKDGIIEKIPDLNLFCQETPCHSFLPHMGVFRMSKETTKCRIVFLSNLCEQKDSQLVTFSHNQAIEPGPCLYQKLAFSLLQLRFDEKVLIFYLKKAFNQIALSEGDSNRLMFLWYKDPLNGDYSIEAYRNVRLSFGLRCSPVILCLALYYILILDTEHDDEMLKSLKKLIYHLFFVDNGAITCNSQEYLIWAYKQLHQIFGKYKFEVQQVVTNSATVQASLEPQVTSEEAQCSDQIALLGCIWNKNTDTISPKCIQLDAKANTKRSVLSTIAAQYDLNNFQCPIMNRAKLFLHGLQCDKSLSWDVQLSEEQQRQWRNITAQANNAPLFELPRMVGKRSDTYDIIACTDASGTMYGVVVYLRNTRTGKNSLIQSKNRIINSTMQKRTIPNLELVAIELGVETIMNLYSELTNESCLEKISIRNLEVYSDSSVALSWISAYNLTLDKMNQKSVYTRNRLHNIQRLCNTHSVQFFFLAGKQNPADCVTRCISYNMLMRTNYLSGPETPKDTEGNLHATVPGNWAIKEQEKLQWDFLDSYACTVNILTINEGGPIVPLNLVPILVDKENELLEKLMHLPIYKRARVIRALLSFGKKLQDKLYAKDAVRFDKFRSMDGENDLHLQRAFHMVIWHQQLNSYSHVFEYFEKQRVPKKDVPKIVTKLNLILDETGILRVKSKMERTEQTYYIYPILLPQKSASELGFYLHDEMKHAPIYTVLQEFRKQFFVESAFAVIKGVIKSCILCKYCNEPRIKLSQNSYREWRLRPRKVPFAYSFMDYLGHYFVRNEKEPKRKVWILIVTCLYTRAINLVIVDSLTVDEFLRAYQLHCCTYGISQYIVSDSGSQLVAGGNIIETFLNDSKTIKQLSDKGMRPIHFDQYPPGDSALGSLVEVCVKLVKKLVNTSLGKKVLTYREFELLIAHAKQLVNKRPIAFKESLRNCDVNLSMPEIITPEKLIFGNEINMGNVIPNLQPIPDLDPDWAADVVSNIRDEYKQLRETKHRLYKTYKDEFLNTLVKQAVNKKDRYKQITHVPLQVNDIVLIKDPMCKVYNCPLARVIKINTNNIGEVTSVLLKKGCNNEVVRRQVTSLVPMLRAMPDGVDQPGDPTTNENHVENSDNQPSTSQINPSNANSDQSNANATPATRPLRKAALEFGRRMKGWIKDNAL